MNESWTTARVINLILLLILLFGGWIILQSLDHQQQHLTRMARELGELREIKVQIEGLDKIVVKHEGLPTHVPAPSAFVPENGGGGTPVPSARRATPSADGKDETGRPYAATPGFEIYPPIGREIPGRTTPRKPDFVPEIAGMFVSGQTSEPDRINYYLTNDGLARRIDREIHERLFTINPDDPQELWPELAISWETSEDKFTYRFHLRKGVEFSDGTLFNADDVIFSYNTLMDPDVESESLKAAFDLVESVRKIDDYTVEMRLRERYWKALKQFGYNLFIFPDEFFEREIPKRAVERNISPYSTVPGEPGFADVFNTFTRISPPGTGPYRWRDGSWVTNQHITLYPNLSSWRRAYNPDYYRIEKLRWRIIKDDVSALEEFRKGNIDIRVVDHNAWEDQIKNDPTITSIADHYVYDHIGLLYSYLGMNHRRFPFDDVNVRRAIAHLMDRERLLRELLRGNGSVAVCPTKPIYAEYSHDLKPRKYDPEKARQILLDSGWADTDQDGLLDKDGRALEFFFSTPSGRTFFTTVTTLLQEACRSVGIRCKADPKEWSLFVTELYDRDFDMVCLYSSASDPWPDNYEDYHSSQTGPRAGNHWGWKNLEVDRLLEAMRKEFDDARRAEMYHEFNHHFYEDVPQLLLLHSKVGVLLNKRFQGAKVRVTGLQNFDMWVDPQDARE